MVGAGSARTARQRGFDRRDLPRLRGLRLGRGSHVHERRQPRGARTGDELGRSRDGAGALSGREERLVFLLPKPETGSARNTRN